MFRKELSDARVQCSFEFLLYEIEQANGGVLLFSPLALPNTMPGEAHIRKNHPWWPRSVALNVDVWSLMHLYADGNVVQYLTAESTPTLLSPSCWDQPWANMFCVGEMTIFEIGHGPTTFTNQFTLSSTPSSSISPILAIHNVIITWWYQACPELRSVPSWRHYFDC